MQAEVRLVGDKEEEMMVWEPGCAAAGDSLLRQRRSMQRAALMNGGPCHPHTVMHRAP